MNPALCCALVLVQKFAATGLLAAISSALVLFAASCLVYRTFRERYLLIWILGWAFYLLYKVSMLVGERLPNLRAFMGISHAAFAVALSLFVAAVFYYTNSRRQVLVVAAAGATALDTAMVRALWFPESLGFLVALYVILAGLAIGAVVQLARSSRGRRQVGPWLLAGGLILLHMHPNAHSVHLLPGIDLGIEILLGMSMLLIALDDSKVRDRRLQVVNAITTAVSQAREHAPMMVIALRELKQLMGASSAWFRILAGDRLVLGQHMGLTENFVRERFSIPTTSVGVRLIDQGKPMLIRSRSHQRELAEFYLREGLEHALLIPVRGRNSVMGLIGLGSNHRRSYRPDELRFLEITANHLGTAVENLRLFEQIVQSQRQWVATFDSIEDLLLVHDSDFRIMRLNRALGTRLGVRLPEVIHQSCESVLPGAGTRWQGCPYCSPDSTMAESADRCLGGFSIVSSSSYSEEGSERRGIVHVIKDTSERRAAEEKYRLLFEQVQEGVFISSPQGKLIDCNHAFVQMLGYSSREELLVVEDIAEQLYPSPEHRQTFQRDMESRGFLHNYEVRLRKKDGTYIDALETSFATRNVEGKIERYQGFILDVTQKRGTEEEIRRRNRELNSLNAIAVMATHSSDLDEILKMALQHLIELFSADTGAVSLFDPDNRRLQRRAAYGHKTDLGKNFSDFEIPTDLWETIRASRAEVLTHLHVPQLPRFISQFIAMEGLISWIWVIMWTRDKAVGLIGLSSRTQREFSVTDENLMVAVGRQLGTTIDKVRLYEETTRAYENLRRTQEQLLQSEKMSAVGQLISGVAHELNNPLTAILGYAQLLENEELSDRSKDFVQKLFKQAKRTQRVVQNLLSFARQRKPQKQQVDIRRVLEDTLSLRDYDLKLSNITVEKDFTSELPMVVADAHQMEQVFLNIINNAVDAMLEVARGGTLRVRIFARDHQVITELRDTGPGIWRRDRGLQPSPGRSSLPDYARRRRPGGEAGTEGPRPGFRRSLAGPCAGGGR